MSLFIAQGLPKSGSTFLFQVAKDVAAAINGIPHYEAKSVFFPGMDVPDFVAQPTDEFIDALITRLPRGASFVVKSHGKLTPFMAAKLESGAIKAVVSFRDPRDTIISMLDAGENDRRKGASRFFGTLRGTDDAIGPAKHGWSVAREWIHCRGVVPIPYYLTATNQNVVIKLLCNYMGAGFTFHKIAGRYAAQNRGQITEFHKGIADRFLDDLAREDVLTLTKSLSVIVDECDGLARRWMGAYGFRLLCQSLQERRDLRFQELLHG